MKTIEIERDGTTRYKSTEDIGVETLARWMDTVFEIPGLGIRFGFDAIIGLIPGIGDTLSAAISLYILRAAMQRGVPRITLMRMMTNITIDYVVGSVPIFGDAFDVYWKANIRNAELLRNSVQLPEHEARKQRKNDWLFMIGIVAVLVLLVVGSITVAGWFLYYLGHMFSAGVRR